MTIYVTNDVIAKEDDYADFLVKECGYSLNEANTRIWEIEYQISRRCHPMLMKPNTKGTIKFKSVLKRQEIQRLVGNATKLSQLVNRRRGNNRNTQWIADYYVTTNGDVFIWKLQCYSMLPEGINKELNNATNKFRNMNNKKVVRLTESQLRNMIQESVKRVLREDLEWDDDGYPINLPDDIAEWASKVQNLCAELVQLKGKYRLEGNWDTLLKQLNNIDNTLNSACADLNTYGMSKHWSL